MNNLECPLVRRNFSTLEIIHVVKQGLLSQFQCFVKEDMIKWTYFEQIKLHYDSTTLVD